MLVISAVVLIPCLWHRVIAASDLGSHLYNAWLTQLIHHGQAPGLWLARQWTNVLFDFLLSGFGSLFGLPAAEKVAVAIAVLIFFWGIFALVCAATRRTPWLLLPCIALVTYGWTLQLGFFNYYLSVGLSFWGLAIFWRGKSWERLAVIPIAVLAAVAHPFGLFWLLAACAYVGIAEALPELYHAALFLVAAAVAAFIHYYFWHHYTVEAQSWPLYWLNGADQLILFGNRYRIPERALATFAIMALAVDAIRRRREPSFWKVYSLPLQLYGIAELGVLLFPRGVHFAQHVPIALITDRLTTLSAAAGCCVLGAMRPSKWHLAASLGIATVFFSFLYQDTAIVSRMEQQVERLVHKLPPDRRVMATIFQSPDSRVLIQHIIDRACIGYCFSYGNYEPGSAVFRVRASPGNPYVLDNYELAIDTEKGTYVVQPEDLPVYQVYQCSSTGTDLCISSLHAGEQNNRLGVYRTQ
ncbi:MAG: hypothetical protein ACRD4Q_03120 [Candidatus Acidiferrales bacterium]